MEKLTELDIERVIATSKDFIINLSGYDLSDLDLTNFDLSRFDLSYTNLKNTVIAYYNFVGEYYGTTLVTPENRHLFEDKELTEVRTVLRGANLEGNSLHKWRWSGLSKMDLREINLANADCYKAEFVGANLEGAYLVGCNFANSKLQWANLRNTNLQGADLTVAYLEGADLRGANLADANLTSCFYDLYTQWPDDFNPDLAGAINLTWHSDLITTRLLHFKLDQYHDDLLLDWKEDKVVIDQITSRSKAEIDTSIYEDKTLKQTAQFFQIGRDADELDVIAVAADREDWLVATTNEKNKGKFDIDVWRYSEAKVQLIASFEGHPDTITSTNFSPDLKLLATSSWDYTVKVWDITGGQLLQNFAANNKPTEKSSVSQAIFCPARNSLIAVYSELFVREWKTDNWEEKILIQEPLLRGSCLAVSSDGSFLAASLWSSRIGLWDLTNGKQITVLSGHSLGICGLAFSPDSKTLASTSYDQKVKIWEVESGRERIELNCGGSWFWPDHVLAFHPTLNNYLAAGVRDLNFIQLDGLDYDRETPEDQIQIWDIEKGKLAQVLISPFEDRRITALYFNHDGNSIVGCFGDLVVIWKINS